VPRKPKGSAAIEKTNHQLERLSIEYVAPGDIHPNDYNPNRQNEHEFTMLCKSIEEDGFTQPVIISEDGVIVDGEHRWRAAQHVGLAAIPVVRVPMDSTQAKIATLRHNRARGSEDIELATDVLRDLERLGALDWAADSLDIGDDELQRLLDDIAAPEALAGEEFTEAWAPQGNAISRDGDISDTATTTSTPAALSAQREHEQALRAAKTEEERQAVMQDKRVFRLVLSFTGEEAEIVRAALGPEPAVQVLTWCQSAGAASAS
jgi:ParB-like chromosome segregation protein Spo0J